MFKIFRFEEKPKDKEIREYLLKEKLNNYLKKNKSALNVCSVHEFSELFKFKNKSYRIGLKNNDKGENFLYTSNTQELIIDMIIVTLDYMENNLNELIKIRKLLNNFFEKK
jgi:hypothetical protein